jgi:hypothetical protein
MFLKPAWMRALVVPEKGKFMAGIDFGSQEFFIQALRSGVRSMIDAYLSGDPYLYFAKQAGAIPPDGTKQTHKMEREAYKATVLGISYLMTKYGLSIKLTNDIGRVYDEDEAQDLINQFYDVFDGLRDYQESITDLYAIHKFIKLPCGWYMFSENDNLRSVTNVPTQGEGGSIMRKAVDLAVGRGVKVLKTLHDAIYIEGDVGDEDDILILRDSMQEAFAFFMPEDLKKDALKIRLDPFAWSPDYKEGQVIKLGKEKWEVPCGPLYLDDRAETEYKMFSKYFNKPSTGIL